MRKQAKLGLFDFTMIVVGLVIGMGIFRTASDSAKASLTPALFFGAWIAGGLVAFCGALTYAEIGSRYPVTGGYYKIFSTCYHPSVAFAINCVILISNATSLSGVALIGSEYISQAFFSVPPSDLVKAMIAMGAILLFLGVNLMGLVMSSKVQTFLMLIKISMILLLIGGLFIPGAATKAPVLALPGDFSWWRGIKSFGVALVAVSFTYGGYQQTINFGDEVRGPRKNIPRAIFIGILIIILLYLSVIFSYYRIIGFDALKNSRGIAAIVAEKLFGPAGKYAFSILLFVAVLGYVNVLLLSNPRVMFAMSEDGILPSAFQKKDEKRDVLTVSLVAFSSVCIVVLFFANTFEKILSFNIFLDTMGMATSAATIFILRKRTRHLNKGEIFSMKWYPLLPIIFIGAYVFVGISIAVDTPRFALIGIAVFLAFLLLYFVVKGFKHKTS